jgi:ankyrin repeat protein
MPDSDLLHQAIRAGDLAEVARLLDAGADVHYREPHGYDAVIDAVFTADQTRLIPLLQLLIDRGANLNGVTDYSESALRVLSRQGRWDVIRFLLNAGADPNPLGWTPLMRLIALGSCEEAQKEIQAGADLSARDSWLRTPWLLSIHTGDIAKAKLLLDAGAKTNDRGRCEKPPLFYAIEGGHPQMLRWLLSLELSPEDRDQFGGTALLEAAEEGQTDCVRILLEAGADIHHKQHGEAAIRQAVNLDVVRLLLAKGADLSQISNEMRRALTKVPAQDEIDCSPEEFLAGKHQLFGTANPQKMNQPFWQAMIRTGKCACEAREHFLADSYDRPAVWCYTRFGKSITEIPDGRIIEIAGEHEDFYDNDFCIYNDVIVHDGTGKFDIYIYPREVFPPTDFHTATLAGNHIYIIGSVGYLDERTPGETPVYRLDIHSLAIEKVKTTGELPGWIGEHFAILADEYTIRINGGAVYVQKDDKKDFKDQDAVWTLDLRTLIWKQL